MANLVVVSLLLFVVMCCLPSVRPGQSQARVGINNQPVWPTGERETATGPEVLTYNELIELYQQDVPSEQLGKKLNKLLTTPFVSNRATSSASRPLKPSSPQIGKFLRVAEWNIERGLEFDAIKLAFLDPKRFDDLMMWSVIHRAM